MDIIVGQVVMIVVVVVVVMIIRENLLVWMGRLELVASVVVLAEGVLVLSGGVPVLVLPGCVSLELLGGW